MPDYLRLSERRFAVRLRGLRMTQHGLMVAIGRIPRSERPHPAKRVAWAGAIKRHGERYGILHIEPRDDHA